MAITKIEARETAEQFLREMGRAASPPMELVILDDYVLQTEFGWIFSYDSKRYLETGELQHALLGNAPLIVNRFDGSIHATGTARPIEDYAEQYLADLERLVSRWGLLVTGLPGDRKATMRALRESLGLTLDEVRAAIDTVPGVLYRGARVDLDPVLTALRAAGFTCELKECAALGALPN